MQTEAKHSINKTKKKQKQSTFWQLGQSGHPLMTPLGRQGLEGKFCIDICM
jgi:hypothetical protein